MILFGQSDLLAWCKVFQLLQRSSRRLIGWVSLAALSTPFTTERRREWPCGLYRSRCHDW